MEIPSPSEATLRAFAVSQLPGVGRKSLHKMRGDLAKARDDRDALEIARPFVQADVADDASYYESAWTVAQRASRYAQRECAKIRARVLSVLDAEFPAVAAGVPDAPFFLSYVGADELVLRGGLLDRWNGLAVIGTREATKEGVEVTNWLVGAVARARAEAVIVSGLAEGVDVAGHRAALSSGLRTVALMAKDLRSTYPAKHRDDAADIVQAGGALVSEYLPEDQPPYDLRGQFVERDRLQSAFSRAVIAVQCGKGSGTMHAMHAAAAQGRGLFAFRFKERSLSEGSEALIAGTAESGKGKYLKKIGTPAAPVSSGADVAAMAALLGSAPGSPDATPPGQEPTSQQTIF